MNCVMRALFGCSILFIDIYLFIYPRGEILRISRLQPLPTFPARGPAWIREGAGLDFSFRPEDHGGVAKGMG